MAAVRMGSYRSVWAHHGPWLSKCDGQERLPSCIGASSLRQQATCSVLDELRHALESGKYEVVDGDPDLIAHGQ